MVLFPLNLTTQLYRMKKDKTSIHFFRQLFKTFSILCELALFGILVFAAYQANLVVLPTCLLAMLTSILALKFSLMQLNTPFKTFESLLGVVSTLSTFTIGLLQSNTLLLFFASCALAFQGFCLIGVYSGHLILVDKEPLFGEKTARYLFIIATYYQYWLLNPLLMSVFSLTHTSSTVIILLKSTIYYISHFLLPVKAASSNTLSPTPHQDTSKPENPLNSALFNRSILPNNKTENNAPISGHSQEYAVNASF